MITKTAPNTNPFVFNSGMATKLQIGTLPIIPEVNENDVCKCAFQCEYTEPVFAKLTDVWWKNDKNSFLFQKLIAADTIVIKILKAGVEIATITDNTYGEYFATFTAQPNYVGFVIFWENVFNLHGAGFYHVTADQTILGVLTTFTSQQFRLLEYTDELADGTTRIETYQTGNIIRSQFDYTDLLDGGWYQSYRIKGRLYVPDPKKKVDIFEDQNYKVTQVRESINNEWTLETKQLPALIYNQLIYDNSISNVFQITDYNIVNAEIFRRVGVHCTDFEKVNEPDMNKERSWKLTFSDDIANIIKTNV